MWRGLMVVAALLAMAAATAHAAGSTKGQLGSRAYEELVGDTIMGAGGEEIGDINNFVADERGRTYAVVGIGGYLGLGVRAVAVPVQNLDVGKERVTLKDMTVEQLRLLPEYRSGQYRSVVPGLGGGREPPRRNGRQVAD